VVAQRREELVQQVAVGGVDLDHLEPRRQGAPGGGLEGRDHLVDTRLVQRHRDRPSLAERDRAGSDDGPAPVRQGTATFPGGLGAGLAPGVGELDAGDRSLGMDEARDAGQGLDVPVAPDPEVGGGDPAVAGDRRGLDHDQGRAAHGATAEVDQVPVVAQALIGAVLAHGGHDDPVAERHAAEGQRTEQDGRGSFRGWVLGSVGHAGHGSSAVAPRPPSPSASAVRLHEQMVVRKRLSFSSPFRGRPGGGCPRQGDVPDSAKPPS
jgi:hypothetical protein